MKKTLCDFDAVSWFKTESQACPDLATKSKKSEFAPKKQTKKGV